MSDPCPLGNLAKSDADRDAVHVAIIPGIAATSLYPGARVAFIGDQIHKADNGAVGIVDPFLRNGVQRGERCFVCLFPNTVTGMRHHWTHPAFDAKPEASKPAEDKAKSEAWLREFCRISDCPDYDSVIAAATGNHDFNRHSEDSYFGSENDGEYLLFRGRDAHGDIPPEFWDHVEIVSGIKIPQSERAPHFSCSC